jgi:Protein of unknown function (DUF2612)
MDVSDYTNLITSEYQQSPNYIAMISFIASNYVYIQSLLNSMIPLFDVDVAVGNQLDIIGQWVGVSRNIAVPISGVYFSWDADYTLGWDYGTWQPSNLPTSVTVLPDDAYRTLIKAKIAANHWDGTTTGAYAIWSILFPTLTILIQDNQNMSYDLAIVGGQVDSLTTALITGGYIPLKPEGVRVDTYYIPIDSNPLFAWDVESEYLGGWDQGSWAREISPT